MLRLEKSARAPENTALKGPELENLCNDRVKIIARRNVYSFCHFFYLDKAPYRRRL